MPTERIAALLVAWALLASPVPARAGSAGFKHEKSIYADDREGSLRNPEGVACTDDGRLVVADTGNGRLLTYTWKDGALRGGVPIKLVQAPYPVRVQIDGKGNVLVLDRKVKKIVRVDGNGGFGGYVEITGASTASAVIPTSFKVDASGTTYVLDVAARRVLVLADSGQVLREVPLPRSPAEFTDIAIAPGGQTIFAIDAVGAALWAAGKDATSFKSVAPSLKDRMNFPVYLTLDPRGRVLVVDQNGNGIVMLGQDGSYQGRELGIGASDGLLYYPAQICVTSGGDAFVADRNNNRVQVFSMTR